MYRARLPNGVPGWRSMLLLAAVLPVLALAACGGDDGEEAAPAEPPPAEPAPTAAAEEPAATEEAPAAEEPAEKVQLEKKTIGIMGPTDSAEIIKMGTDAADQGAKALGWETIRVDPAGDPAKMGQGMTSLVNSNVDAIVLVVIEPATIQAGLQAAADAGIPVINTLALVESSDLVAGEYWVDLEIENQMLADRMAADLPEGAEIGGIFLPQFLNANIAGELFRETAQENGWNLVAEHDADLANLVPDVNAAVGDMLRANPNISAIFGVGDFVPPGAVPAIESAGEDVVVYSVHGIPSTVPFVEAGRAIVEVADYQKAPIVAIDELAAFFAMGDPISEEMPGEYDFEYLMLDSTNAAEGYPFPTETVIAPFLEKWAEMYEPAS